MKNSTWYKLQETYVDVLYIFHEDDRVKLGFRLPQDKFFKNIHVPFPDGDWEECSDDDHNIICEKITKFVRQRIAVSDGEEHFDDVDHLAKAIISQPEKTFIDTFLENVDYITEGEECTALSEAPGIFSVNVEIRSVEDIDLLILWLEQAKKFVFR